MLDVAAAAFVLAGFEVLPLPLHPVVILQLGVGLYFPDALLNEYLVDVIDHHGINPPPLVFGFHGDQVEVSAVVLFERSKQVDESEWK